METDITQKSSTESPYKSYEKELLYHEFEHVRFIHFSLLFVSATLIYLLWANWSDAPELEVEAGRLMSAYGSITSRDARAVAQRLPEIARLCRERAKAAFAIYTGTNQPMEFGEQILDDGLILVDPPSDWQLIHKTPLNEIQKEFLDPNGFFACINSISDLQTAHEWIQSVIHETSNKGDYIIDHISAPELVSLKVLRWPDRDSGNGRLQARLKIDIVEIVEGGDKKPTRREHHPRFSDYEFMFTIKRSAASEEFFARQFPKLSSNWTQIRRMTIGEIREWSWYHRADDLKKSNINVLGLEISGKHLGLIGPVAILSLLLYLLAYVVQLWSFLKNHPVQLSLLPFAAPWMGAIPNTAARLITAVTLIVLPSLGCQLALWRLLIGIDFLSSLAMSAVVGAVGGGTFWYGYRISREIASALNPMSDTISSGTLAGDTRLLTGQENQSTDRPLQSSQIAQAETNLPIPAATQSNRSIVSVRPKNVGKKKRKNRQRR